MNVSKVGISLLWLPWSGKTWLLRWLNIPGYHSHDLDNDGLENKVVWYGKWWVAQLVQSVWDRCFLERESQFLITHYGRAWEWKFFTLDNMILSTSGSIVKVDEWINYLRERTHTILLRTSRDDQEEIDRVMINIWKRRDWSKRIVWMNGWPNWESAESKNIEEELWKRMALYREYADYIFEYPFTRNKGERIYALREFIIKKRLISIAQ